MLVKHTDNYVLFYCPYFFPLSALSFCQVLFEDRFLGVTPFSSRCKICMVHSDGNAILWCDDAATRRFVVVCALRIGYGTSTLWLPRRVHFAIVIQRWPNCALVNYCLGTFAYFNSQPTFPVNSICSPIRVLDCHSVMFTTQTSTSTFMVWLIRIYFYWNASKPRIAELQTYFHVLCIGYVNARDRLGKILFPASAFFVSF